VGGIQEGDKIYISLENHFKALKFGIVGTLFMLATLYFLRFNPDATMIFGFFWVALTAPALYLHIEYLLKNSGQSIKIENRKLVKTKRNKSIEYKFEDIEKVVLYKSASLDKGGIPLSPMEPYHYARIFMKSNEEVVITCLLVPDVDKFIDLLKGVEYHYNKIPFNRACHFIK
jgi:hypothetical protein